MDGNRKLYIANMVLCVLVLIFSAAALAVNIAVYWQRSQVVAALSDLERRVSALEEMQEPTAQLQPMTEEQRPPEARTTE